MWSIIDAAGWPIWSILVASVVALAIIFERAVSLRTQGVAPAGLLLQVIEEYKKKTITVARMRQWEARSALGRILAVGLRHAACSREVIKEAIEDEGRVVALQLERFLTTLGSIATMAPLLGLLGTVVGMIELFGAQTPTSIDPYALAHGISVALYNTAMGLIVAIPSMLFYRYFRARVDALLIDMEAQALTLLTVLQESPRSSSAMSSEKKRAVEYEA